MDDGDLNFDKGDRVATVLKGIAEMSYRQGNTVGFVRAKAWSDFLLEDHGMPWGNVGNGYVSGQPLNDDGAARLSRFSGMALMDTWLALGPDAPGAARTVKIGRQSVAWAAPSSIGGGLDQLNPQDLAARARPGYRTEEFAIPVAALSGRYSVTRTDTVEAFLPLQYKPNAVPMCGTFSSYSDYLPSGCDKVLVGNLTDYQSVTGRAYATRLPDRLPDNQGQYAMRFAHLSPDFGLFGFHIANVHSHRQSVSVASSTRVGAPPLIPGNADGKNVQYFADYPSSVHLYALTWGAQIPAQHLSLSAELTYSPNQMLRLNATDLLNAFASTTAPTLLRAEAQALPPGATYEGYDRRKVSQLLLGTRKLFDKVLMAQQFTLSGEAGFKYVHGLPHNDVRRYGRNDFSGIGPVNGACTGPDKQCSEDGYVTRLAWGYRLMGELKYPGALPGTTLIPSLSYGHDVNGWAYDDSINQGRQFTVLGLRSEFVGGVWLDVSWQAIWGGAYNPTKDRDVLSLVLGAQF
jgi:hypothetical protein